MKKTILIIAGLLLTIGALAQHLPKLSQYELNKNLINPAAITSEDFNINLLYRNQWTGFEDAPQTFGLNAFKSTKIWDMAYFSQTTKPVFLPKTLFT